jgi:hypothetical protein
VCAYNVPYDNPRNEVEHTPLFHMDETNEFGRSFELPQGVGTSATVLLELYLLKQQIENGMSV